MTRRPLIPRWMVLTNALVLLLTFGCNDDPSANGMDAADGPGGSDGPGSDGPGSDGPPPGCPVYQMFCSGSCIPTSEDPDNCGGCGTVCTSAQVCSGGACGSSCLTGLSPCGRSCVDLKTNNQNCGSCGNPCGAGNGCVNGTCQPTVTTGPGPTTCPRIEFPTPGNSATQTCAGDLAQITFRWALCSCTNVSLSDTFLTDGFDGASGPYVPGSLGGGVGLNGHYGSSSMSTLWGALWSSDSAGLVTSGAAAVKQELHLGGGLATSQAFSVGEDAFINGNVSTSNAITFAGALHLPSNAIIVGNVTSGSVLRRTINVPAPCDCAMNQLIDIQGIVQSHVTSNDNASIGLDPAALMTGAGAKRLDLPCGNFYLSGITSGAPIAIVAHGRTALFIGGDIAGTAPLSITVDPDAELDLFVQGTIASSGPVSLGSANHPALMRTYVGGMYLALSSSITVGGFLYAPKTQVASSGSKEIFGGVFAGDFSTSDDTAIHYDRAVLRAGDSCKPPGGPPPPADCMTCRDCGNQACINGTCAACTSSDQCCAPLVCNQGQCVAIVR